LYEGLFILKTSGKEEGIKETTDKVCAEITAAGGKVETVQKMDKRAFARVADSIACRSSAAPFARRSADLCSAGEPPIAPLTRK